MKWEPTYVPDDWAPDPDSEPVTLTFHSEDWVPPLTAEEAERGTVFLVQDDGTAVEAHTIVDPETGGVYAVPKD